MSVDDLLDELDGLLRDDAPAPKRGVKPTAAAAPESDDIDALLADLGGGEPPPPAKLAETRSSASNRAPAAAPSPASSSGNQTNMRCTSCDFRVLCFRDQEWTKDVDYMFFRNFMPDATKLKAKLRARDGYDAYACQCAWATVELGDQMPNDTWFTVKATR